MVPVHIPRPDRLPFTMLTLMSFFVALYMSLKNDRYGSYIFGPMHLIAFGFDLCSRLPGGQLIFKVRQTIVVNDAYIHIQQNKVRA